MTLPSHAQLASLIGSRLCHDLISPIGAIQNGLELVELSGSVEGGSPEFSLIQESCQNAAARIKYFRVAFGSSKSSQMMSQSEVVSVISDLNAGARIRSDWKPSGDLSRGDVQLAFLAMMCCETALPQGGSITIDRDAAGWSLSAAGPKISAHLEQWNYLNGSGQMELTANMVQFPMLRLLSEERDKKILVTPNDATLTLKIA